MAKMSILVTWLVLEVLEADKSNTLPVRTMDMRECFKFLQNAITGRHFAASSTSRQ